MLLPAPNQAGYSVPSALAVVYFMLVTALAGCSSTIPRADLPTDLPDAFPHHNVDQIRQMLSLQPDTLHGFAAKASVAVNTPHNHGSFTALMSHRRNDSLYMSIRVKLGIEAARALVTPDSFFVYDRIEKEVVYGSLASAYSSMLLPTPFRSDELFPNLLGLVSPEVDVSWQVEADSSKYFLRDPEGLRTYTIDPTLWRIIRYQEKSPTGNIVEERYYTEFDLFENMYLPRRVIYRRPGDDMVASIFYRSLDLNPPNYAFDLRVKDGVDRILVY